MESNYTVSWWQGEGVRQSRDIRATSPEEAATVLERSGADYDSLTVREGGPLGPILLQVDDHE